MKGQSSMEFLALVSLSMFMLAVLYTVMADKQVETFQEQSQENAEQIANKVSFNLEMALVQGEGYSRVFSIPQNIAGKKYSLEVEDGVVKVDWGDSDILRSSRFHGRDINVTVNDSNIFRVKHNQTGVFLVEQ